MKEDEFKQSLVDRRTSLKMTYKEIKERTELGYNTVRRVFKDPWNCRIESVLKVLRSMGCDLIFTVENKIGDELETEKPIEPVTEKDVDEEL